MQKPSAGYREIEHTADWELEVWAPDLPGLLEQAARGMYSLAGAQFVDEPPCTRSILIHAFDPETLLVRFLSELLYLADREGLGFDDFIFDLHGEQLVAQCSGRRLATWSKEIKAVTYHNLKVHTGLAGLDVRIVFDV